MARRANQWPAGGFATFALHIFGNRAILLRISIKGRGAWSRQRRAYDLENGARFTPPVERESARGHGFAAAHNLTGEFVGSAILYFFRP
jgi:hypothetical protein